MSAFAVPDILGVTRIRVNDGDPVVLRNKLKLTGGVDARDNAQRARSEWIVPDDVFRTITIDSGDLAVGGELTPWVVGLSAANLIRLDSGASEAAVVGLADAIPIGGGYYSVQAIPEKTFKHIANVGIHDITLRPPAVVPTDPDMAGIFIDSITLHQHDVVRVVWDGVSFGYRIMGGNHTYLVYEGQYVVHEGRRIYLRS